MKSQYAKGELPKEGGLDSLQIYEGAWQKRGVIFWRGVEIPKHVMNWRSLLLEAIGYRHKISKANNIG